MGNRRKTPGQRVVQSYRNVGRHTFAEPRRRRDGEWRRGEGHDNVPYGPLKGFLAGSLVRRLRKQAVRHGWVPPEYRPEAEEVA